MTVRTTPRLGRLLAALGVLALAAAVAGCTNADSENPSPAAAVASTDAATPATSPSTSSASTGGGITVVVPTGSTDNSPSPTTSAATTPSTLIPTTTPTTTTPPKPKPKPAKVSANPKLGSTGLAPKGAIVITASGGTIKKLSVVNAESGAAIKGTLSADRTTWKLGEALGYGQTYKVIGTAVGEEGLVTKISGSYTTVAPDAIINSWVTPSDGDTVGIGAPIMIGINAEIDDQAARARIEKAITVTTVPKTEGAFAWIQHDDGWGLDWRPKSYWKSGTKVTVQANLYGVDFGNGLWGEKDFTSSFKIGRAEVVKGDVNTHRLKVYVDGKLKFDFPTSYGLESDPGRVTHSGTYIVMSKEYLHLMSNPAYHYFNFKAYYAVRISDNGTFIHANDGTTYEQGYYNVTHGCANLTTENAKLYYDQVLYGDPVEITGSSIALSASDGDTYDWTIPWSQWKTLSALHQS
jgi:lipoprotein-anchoring transpeptidase ErfK/SrfK